MTGILAYGSLMHPAEFARHFAGEPDRAPERIPVRVSGFSRGYCQEPSWRDADGDRRGVLTVTPSADGWINAILICGCDSDMLTSLDARERGYDRCVVAPTAIEPCAGGVLPDALREVVIYVGRSELRNEALLPNPTYRALCITAAAQWGDAFLEEFLASTDGGRSSREDHR